MTFLNPGLAVLGLLCALAPLIIYLIFFRRYTPVAWSAMEILRRALKKRSKRTRLQDLILLVVRTLLLLFFAIALARPLVSGRPSGFGQDSMAVIIVDNTLSMGVQGNSGTLFEEAKAGAIELIRRLPESTRLLPLALSGSDLDSASPVRDRSRAERLIEEMALVSHSQGVLATLDRARAALAVSPQSMNRVYILTDGQRSTWPLEEPEIKQSLDSFRSLAPVRLLSLTPENPVNISLLEPSLDGLPATVGRPVIFRVSVKSQNVLPGTEIPVILTVDGNVAARQAVRSGAENQIVEFRRLFRDAGFHRVTVSLEPDALPDDNTARFAVKVRDAASVLLVEGKGREALYLGAAIAPLEEGLGETVSPYTVTRIRPGDVRREDLNKYDIAVVADLSALDAVEAAQLFNWVRLGGAAILAAPAGGALPEGLGVTLGEPIVRREGETPFSYEITSEGRRVLKPFQSEAFRRDLNSIRSLSAQSFVLEAGSRGQSWLEGPDNRTVLAEVPLGEGGMVLWGMSLNTQESDLVLKMSFAPLVRQIADRLSVSRETFNLIAGQSWTTPLARSEVGGDLLLSRPDGGQESAESYIPAATESGTIHFQLPVVNQSGFYSLGRSRSQDVFRLAAVNADAGESDLNYVPDPEWNPDRPDDKDVWTLAAYLDQGFQSDGSRSERGAPLAILALFFILLDSFLSWKFGGSSSIIRRVSGAKEATS